MRTRNAILTDAPKIHGLIQHYARLDVLLPRTLPEICENIRDFVVADYEGHIVGCGALHLYGVHLAEVRSVAVDPEFQSHGTGTRLVRSLLAQARRHRVACVCLFTRIPEYFAAFGFSPAARGDIPDKLYKDCCQCPKLHQCDEVAMVRGVLPKFAILPQPASWAVKLQT